MVMVFSKLQDKFRTDEFVENGKKRWRVIDATYRYTVCICTSAPIAKRIATLLSQYGERND